MTWLHLGSLAYQLDRITRVTIEADKVTVSTDDRSYHHAISTPEGQALAWLFGDPARLATAQSTSTSVIDVLGVMGGSRPQPGPRSTPPARPDRGGPHLIRRSPPDVR